MRMLMGQSASWWSYMAGRYPDQVGMLVGPSYANKNPIRPWFEFALDNGAFVAYRKKEEWDRSLWIDMLDMVRLLRRNPLWAVVPDVVGDKVATRKRWFAESGVVQAKGWRTAFAVQDGMTPDDVPQNADVLFVGGTDAFKWRHLRMWTDNFPRVHVGRVNTMRHVHICEDLGVESVDGTMWFRDPTRPSLIPALEEWFAGNRCRTQQEIDFEVDPAVNKEGIAGAVLANCNHNPTPPGSSNL